MMGAVMVSAPALLLPRGEGYTAGSWKGLRSTSQFIPSVLPSPSACPGLCHLQGIGFLSSHRGFTSEGIVTHLMEGKKQGQEDASQLTVMKQTWDANPDQICLL